MSVTSDSLPRDFYLRDALEVARDLLGRILVVRGIGDAAGDAGGDAPAAVVRIVETEAYRRDDPASHAFRGPTARNASMFLEGGRAYVYRIYGIHRCLNVVTGLSGIGEAVLIRAVEPLEGIASMWRRRYGQEMPADGAGKKSPDRRLHGLSDGPGKLCLALGIDVAGYDGTDLLDGPLRILNGHPVDDASVGRSPRIGLSAGKGEKEPWRFFVSGNRFVSRRLPGNLRTNAS